MPEFLKVSRKWSDIIKKDLRKREKKFIYEKVSFKTFTGTQVSWANPNSVEEKQSAVLKGLGS